MGRPAEPPALRPRRRPGVALPAAIFGIVIVSLLTAGAWSITELDLKATSNRVDAAVALRLAQTAETHALAVLRNRMKDTTFNRFLRGYDNTSGTSDDGLLAGYPVLGDSLSIPAEGVVWEGFGTYYVTIVDDPRETDGLPYLDSNRRLLIRCRGVATGGSTTEINVVVANFLLPALAVEGNLEISSTMTATSTGACGGIHANGNITGGGTTTVTTAATATGSIDHNVIGTKLPNSPAVEIPDLNPSDFCGPTGPNWVYVGNGTSTYLWKPGILPRPGDPITGVTYCVTGNVEFQSDFGTALLPSNVTIIASGSIKVGGKKIYTSAAHPDDIVLMAGGDLDLQSDASFTGMLYAGGQCYISGIPNITGQFICRNRDPHPGENWVQLSDGNGLLISGDATFNFTCSSMLSSVFGVVAWYPTIGS
jgi:hypothetical protein